MKPNKGAFPRERIRLNREGKLIESYEVQDKPKCSILEQVRQKEGDSPSIQLEHGDEETGWEPVGISDLSAGALLSLAAVALMGLALWGYALIRAAGYAWAVLT
jgi:hypothetical protein